MNLKTSLLCLPPLSLYIHVPWCVKKCPYCDFNSHVLHSELPESSYIDSLITDFKKDAKYIQQRTIQSIFIGGGTPSLFSAASYSRLFIELQKEVEFSKTIEITMEANPGTLEYSDLNTYAEIGINRLSVGVQSFHADNLKNLGRIHTANDAVIALQKALDANFDQLNIDLMFGLPTQSCQNSLKDLQQAIDLKPHHISWYQLTLEPNTEFYRKPPRLPEEEDIYDMWCEGKKLLEKNNYNQYEISAYARRENQCRHNLNYWQFGDYIGIGAGAHGKITLNKSKIIVRTRKTRLPKDYLFWTKNTDINSIAVETLIESDFPIEYLMNTLRLNKGFKHKDFSAYTGLDFSKIKDKINIGVERRLLVTKDGRTSCTQFGFQHLNSLLEIFT